MVTMSYSTTTADATQIRDSSAQRRTGSPDSVNSSETVELPPRFDQEGRKVPEQAKTLWPDKIEDLLNGKGLPEASSNDLLCSAMVPQRGVDTPCTFLIFLSPLFSPWIFACTQPAPFDSFF